MKTQLHTQNELIAGMTELQATNKAAEIWGDNSFADDRIFQPRRFAVGVNNCILGHGDTWEEAFSDAKVTA